MAGCETVPDNGSQQTAGFRNLLDSVVRLDVREASFRDGTKKSVRGVGSGVILDTEGYILTNAHVVGSDVEDKGVPTGGHRISCGPSRNLNFPFVLLGRALTHQRLISSRTHADRGELDLSQPLLDWLDDRERRRLAKIFDDLRSGRKAAQRRAELAALVLGWCQQND